MQNTVFTLKTKFSDGSTIKSRFISVEQLPLILASLIRVHGLIVRAWLKCSCHNVEEELKLPV